MSIKLNAQSGGSVALDAPTQTTSSADLTFKLPVADGSANQLLKTDGSGNLGWATDQGGKILQIKQGSTTTYTATTNTSSYVDSTLSETITPTAASSKILVQISQSTQASVASYNTGIYLQLVEGSTAIYTSSSQSFYFFFGGGNNSANAKARWSLVYLHTPSYSLGDTLTYKTQQKSMSDAATTSARTQPSSDPSYIILSEVAA